MFLVLLKFSDNKSQASAFMDGHNQWLERGFAEGVFVMAGSLASGQGGTVLVHDKSRDVVEQRVNEDPFVIENIVAAEIIEIEPKRVDERLGFLMR